MCPIPDITRIITTTRPHDDRDVSLVGDALTQSGKWGLDLPLLLAVLWLVTVLFARLRITAADSRSLPLPHPASVARRCAGRPSPPPSDALRFPAA